MWTIVIGIVVNLFVSYGAYTSLQDLQQVGDMVQVSTGSLLLIVLVVIAAFWLLSVAGLLMILAGRKKAGAIMVIVGSIPTIPAGVIAIVGARNVLKSLGNDLDARRKLAPGGGAQPPSA